MANILPPTILRCQEADRVIAGIENYLGLKSEDQTVKGKIEGRPFLPSNRRNRCNCHSVTFHRLNRRETIRRSRRSVIKKMGKCLSIDESTGRRIRVAVVLMASLIYCTIAVFRKCFS